MSTNRQHKVPHAYLEKSTSENYVGILKWGDLKTFRDKAKICLKKLQARADSKVKFIPN